jgi:hypothetical protein
MVMEGKPACRIMPSYVNRACMAATSDSLALARGVSALKGQCVKNSLRKRRCAPHIDARVSFFEVESKRLQKGRWVEPQVPEDCSGEELTTYAKFNEH